MLDGRQVLLIVSGGIAAYKALDLIRRLRERGASVRPVVTKGGQEFVTPLSLAALAESPAYTDLFSLKDEAEMGHIRLARDADVILVAPATADLLAKMAHGLADDLASTLLLAADKPILVAPAMNHRMWEHPATKANVAILAARGVGIIAPGVGAMACGETGTGRLAESEDILAAVEAALRRPGVLSGRRALVTSGPTYEPIDPVRYIGNHSSGKQGHAIAEALAALGAETVLVTGPTALADPRCVRSVHVETAAQMLAACRAALPVDVAVCAAAVADWRAAKPAAQKLKKTGRLPDIKLAESVDVLRSLSAAGNLRPRLVVGFAAETEALVERAQAKRAAKGCDWIVANDVTAGVFGSDDNSVVLVTDAAVETWPKLTKREVGHRLAARIAQVLTHATLAPHG
ncbi:MAG: bifunctional phosphopantothenoylcysteine decarboxylase/phosphopantothenate--cysteine ligase CoaBC [Alphaproteobacteria bacterium]|nr:bifunctional phosphopantothenoylcysteine decarboxylase/phosphopantothenate--cysteine ligase CoaBC [Alphaproteobacteria bacterium]